MAKSTFTWAFQLAQSSVKQNKVLLHILNAAKEVEKCLLLFQRLLLEFFLSYAFIYNHN